VLSNLFFLLNNNLLAQSVLEVKFQPSNSLYVYETRGLGTPAELYSAVIQNIAIINHANENIIIDEMNIIITKEGNELQRHMVEKSIISQSAKKFKAYQGMGVLQLYDFQFQTSRYLKGITLADSTTLAKEQAVIIPHRTMLFESLPDLATIHVKGHYANGTIVNGKGELKIINHQSKNQYDLPLKGRWSVFGAPSLISHHRWGTIQEFAFDFVKIGDDNITHKNDGSKLTDYYAYGEPVYSIGDGTVIAAFTEGTESDQNLKQPNETAVAYLERLALDQQKLLKKGFSFVMGNHIIIKHNNNEYSYYAHLKSGSISLKAGDMVKKGQQIAKLGHSGNSTEPHLHFHVTDGPDISYSRSIPVSFQNISFFPDDIGIRHIHYGQIIFTND